MTLLSADSLTAGFGDSRAITDISLFVNEGELLALVGANGAGKSTLLSVLAGAHRPSGGSVVFKGTDVTGQTDFQRNRLGIALVPEGRRLFSSLTVHENLLVGAGSHRSGQWNVDTVVSALPMLEPLLGRNASRLSGGQQQAVAIGRGLMSNPEVLLLDEVSLGLAPIVIDELYRSLETVRASGLGIILVEQDLARTVAVADRLICLLEGHLVLEGSPDQLTHEAITQAYFGQSIASFPEDTAATNGGM